MFTCFFLVKFRVIIEKNSHLELELFFCCNLFFGKTESQKKKIGRYCVMSSFTVSSPNVIEVDNKIVSSYVSRGTNVVKGFFLL
jgi:hypothetical protein